MQLRLPATLLAALVISTSAFAQSITTIEEAHRSYHAAQYGRSLALYLQLATEGDAEAAERAGFMLLLGGIVYGTQVDRDVDSAKQLLLQAARSGRSGASVVLTLLEATD
ncbi:MAG: hypothetical protein H7Y61_16805 [Rhizobiales bacterium]|nr:hypothetical protein [Rhizobacter sp.]